MATHITSAPVTLGDMVTAWLRSLRHIDARPPRALEEDTRARRDFICDMLRESPGAFVSETDVQTMMQVYPCRF